jgi:hypothetical protein
MFHGVYALAFLSAQVFGTPRSVIRSNWIRRPVILEGQRFCTGCQPAGQILSERSEPKDPANESAKDEISKVIGDGGQGRDRTADAGLFRAALYH